MAEVDNYYILLDLDPSVDDWPTVEKAIANKKIEWSKNANTGIASKRTEARRLLDLIGDISSVLSDSQNRRDIAGKAKTILENRHRKAFEDLEPVIAMITAGGGTVTEKQIISIHQETGKAITMDEIRDFLRKAGITIEGEVSPKKKVQKPLIDKSLIKEIRKDLDYLKVKNLYAFLGLDENDLLKTLQEESQNVYRRIMSLPISPEIDAKKRLAGHCQKIFKTEDEKIKYDNSMNEEPLYELEAMIKLAGKDDVITKEKMEQIIELAAKKGVKPEVTIEYVTEYADKKGWKILQTEMVLVSQNLKQVLNQSGKLEVSTNAIDFSDIEIDSKSTKSFKISNESAGGVLIGTITTNVPWIKISECSFNVSGNKDIEITVNTSGLGYGFRGNGDIIVKSSGGDEIIKITLSTEIQKAELEIFREEFGPPFSLLCGLFIGSFFAIGSQLFPNSEFFRGCFCGCLFSGLYLSIGYVLIPYVILYLIYDIFFGRAKNMKERIYKGRTVLMILIPVCCDFIGLRTLSYLPVFLFIEILTYITLSINTKFLEMFYFKFKDNRKNIVKLIWIADISLILVLVLSFIIIGALRGE